MAIFKIQSIRIIQPEDDFLMWNYGRLTEHFGSPLPDEVAIRVARYQNIHKCLVPGSEYKLINTDAPLSDDFFMIKEDRREGDSDVEISVSAIVGQNGSGKSTLIELLIRLFNNFAFAFKNAYVGRPAIPLQFVEDIYAEMTYQMSDGHIYVLRQKGAVISCETQGQPLWTYDHHQGVFIAGNEAIYHLNNCFFFTIVLNYSSYSYNLYNYRPEWRELPPNDELEYTDEDRCWLSAIFHKNDAYQTPIVLNPFRSFGEIDFNNEADLTRDRLFLLSVQNVDMMSVLMEGMKTHSIVLDTKMPLVEQPKIPYSSPQLIDVFIQMRTIAHRYDVHDAIWGRCQRLCDIVVSAWSEIMGEDLAAPVQDSLLQQDRRRAINYLVYKTIKVTRNYAIYSSYRQCFVIPRETPDDLLDGSYVVAEDRIPQLVKELWEDQTHVTLKLHKTLAFLKFKHYQLGMGNEPGMSRHQVSAQRYNGIIEDLYQKLGGDEQNTWKREDLLPAPCFDARLILSEKKRDNDGNIIEGVEELRELNTMSSGQMQLLYSLSTVLYHLKNIDSNIISGKNALRYPSVNIIFDEIELYFHPYYQKDLVYDLIYAIRRMNYQGIKHLNIIVATHSPYILSDFPKNNVLCLEKGHVYQDKVHQMGSTFAANVYDILNSRFFMDDFVGKFAVKKLDEIIKEATDGLHITIEEYKQRLTKVELIGDVFVKEKLKEELLEKLNERERREMAIEEIRTIERRKQYLNGIIDGNGLNGDAE